MGYNSKCNYQNCTQGCCNTYGNCPTSSAYGSSLSTRCKYYYTNTQQLEGGAIVGVVAGPILGLIIIIIIVVCSVKRCKRKALKKAAMQNAQNKPINLTTQQMTEYNITDPNQIVMQNQQQFGQPYGQPFGAPVPPMNMQMGMPMNPTPLVQPQPYYAPEQALFGQQQPPVVPGMQGAPGMFGPNPILR